MISILSLRQPDEQHAERYPNAQNCPRHANIQNLQWLPTALRTNTNPLPDSQASAEFCPRLCLQVPVSLLPTSNATWQPRGSAVPWSHSRGTRQPRNGTGTSTWRSLHRPILVLCHVSNINSTLHQILPISKVTINFKGEHEKSSTHDECLNAIHLE